MDEKLLEELNEYTRQLIAAMRYKLALAGVWVFAGEYNANYTSTFIEVYKRNVSIAAATCRRIRSNYDNAERYIERAKQIAANYYTNNMQNK